MTLYTADAGFVFIAAGQGTWSVTRLPGAEAALEDKSLSARTLTAALRAARGSMSDADAHPMAAQLAEGMLLSLLAPLVPKAGALSIIPS